MKSVILQMVEKSPMKVKDVEKEVLWSLLNARNKNTDPHVKVLKGIRDAIALCLENQYLYLDENQYLVAAA